MKGEIMRIINAERFKQLLWALCISENGDVEKTNQICQLIDTQPTAYDVDKVVKRIDNLFPLQTTAGTFVSKEDVIRLVKGGGVDE